jgi:hypothetical protein
MGESFSTTTRTSWGQNLGKSIKGVFIGLIMFLASFVVLWVNEGRMDLSKVAVLAEEVSADSVDAAFAGELVSVTGNLTTTERLGDPQFLRPGEYIALSRSAEMYAWIQDEKTETRDLPGGGTETTTTYTYRTDWTSSPQDSSSFHRPEGHQNPRMPYENRSYTVSTAKVGTWAIDPQRISLPGRRNRVELTDANAILGPNQKIEQNFIFIPHGETEGSLNTPKVGDVRISFSALENNVYVTAFGEATSDGRIVSYEYAGEKKAARDKLRRDATLYHAREGSRSTAIQTLAGEHKMMLWILRIVGFVLMWVGLQMFFGPLVTVLKVIPFLGRVGKGVVGVITFITALVLSGFTIVIAMLARSVIALLILLAIVVFLTIFLISRGKKKSQEKPAA